MVGKRVLQGEAWSDLSDSYGTHDLGDHFGDLATLATNLATILAIWRPWRQMDDSRKCNPFPDISTRKRIREETPCDVTACRREYLRTVPISAERL
ncbi:hypothetical protein AVEN_1059-1 [Araneus ventricosus]|uniref:Uncharacterized protein n=1 Tax=Araneus ventricosus TaxID=182803 RepID=A0A4Y2KR74_ARAVE|nr:hypothetical protein AVEN_1059-1 [Araneus ventricosus]